MFDIFYYGQKPNLFPHERCAESIQHAQQLSRTRFFWWINYLSSYRGWDFLWEPVPWQCHQRHAWPSQWQKDSGTYLVPKAEYTDTNYHDDKIITRLPSLDNWLVPQGIEEFDLSWHPDPSDPDMQYQFGTQHQRTGGPRYIATNSNVVKYVQQPRASKTAIDPNWERPDNVEEDSFDWTWHPDATELPYIYQFGTQHQRTGGPRYLVPGATSVKYVDQIRIKTQCVATAIVEIDHLDGNAGLIPNVSKASRYFDNYLDTLRRIANNIGDDHEFVWICSSVCDYSDFDWTWHPEQWQATMLHVFASDNLKFGDTFFMHVPSFRERAARVKLLEWYDVNFVDRSVPRRPVPVVQHDRDSHVDAMRDYQTRAPVTVFATGTAPDRVPPINLWRPELRTVIPLDRGACRVVVPREALSTVRTQLYDYAYIDKTHLDEHKCEPLDIVFISNGETNADQNWARLLLSKQGRPNRCVRVDGVNGRAAAYHAAAEASETPWFFAVFAKLEVLDNFDWSWQPDRLQQPKHYIFHALNPVNMLEYGHQAMIAYNRRLTLANPGRGLDFTLDDAHEVVPVLSGVARYNVDAWTAWRTAFREVIKLRASLPDVESEYRIRQWVSVGNGPYGQHSRNGAQDALDYYDEVNGDFVELRKSYEWAWLARYALVRRNLAPGQ